MKVIPSLIVTAPAHDPLENYRSQQRCDVVWALGWKAQVYVVLPQ